jgi:uncharacterized protein DUF29
MRYQLIIKCFFATWEKSNANQHPRRLLSGRGSRTVHGDGRMQRLARAPAKKETESGEKAMAGSFSADIGLDYHEWLVHQARKLRASRPAFLDWENLAEELEAMARSEELGLESLLERLLKHLLKWSYQSGKISGSWEASIENSRDQIERRLERSPSLNVKLPQLCESAYRRAKRTAGAEMRLRKEQWEKRLPESCPWTVWQIRDASFWPRPANGANGQRR